MILTKHSKELTNFFIQHNCVHHERIRPETRQTLIVLYNMIKNANIEIKNTQLTKKVHNVSFMEPAIKPKSFTANNFPATVIKHIDSTAAVEVTYQFSLKERNMTVHFILENASPANVSACDNHIKLIIHAMHVLTLYSNKECSRNLNIFIYMTSLKKVLPKTNAHVLDQLNANTAFTRTCMPTSEIVIFRKEEWFKVLIHESFHNFGFDFADMNNHDCHSKILEMFKVSSEVNLYEAYTECWAEIINACFCSFFILRNTNDVNEYLTNADFFINFERTYSFFQLVKTLDFMGLTYQELYASRNSKYKEKTNILAYYVIKTIMLHNFQDFLSWCKKHNTSLFQFKKDARTKMELCYFIESKYKSPSLLKNIYVTDAMFKKVKGKSQLAQNMRMTMFELG